MKNKKIKKAAAIFFAAVLSLCMTSCRSDRTKDGGIITTADAALFATEKETAEVTEDFADDLTLDESGPKTVMDREGNIIQVADDVKTIVSTAPSITEILCGLGLSKKIIAADIYSADVKGISPDICTMDFYNLNIEELTALAPDLIIVSGMSMGGADDPYAALKEAGVNVIYIPTSNSITGIKLDIEFLAAYLYAEPKGEKMLDDIDKAVREVSERAEGCDVRSVYFEIGAAPYLYSGGGNTFIDEMIALSGGRNIYSGENGWLSNSEESVIAANPDVIITNVDYEGYDYNEIKSRAGWENITAVKAGAVYRVDANLTSRPSQHIAEGIYQVAAAIHPELYAEYHPQ